MNWLYYLAEANLYLCVFYLAYCLFLVRETHYQLNRAYLLLSCVMAFVLPVLQVGALRPNVQESNMPVFYQIAQPVQYATEANIAITPIADAPAAFNINDYLWLAYVGGAVIVLLLLTLKLYSVFKLTRNNKAAMGRYKIVYLKDTDVAFSFFNYLFIGTRAAGANTIITHELVHIKQKHSVDIMFLELLKVICWFNPCIYMLQSSLKTVHEYIADEQTAATETDALTYSSFLVNNAYGTGGSSITHSFFNYNLLKKRIIMLNQQRSGKLARLKYLIALPVCAGLLCASTLAFSKTYGWVDLKPVAKIALPDTLKTSKGFKYKEKIYSKNGYKYCDVIFFEANGQTKTFTSNSMTEAKLILLKQHYDYQFPAGTVPPPPPPMPSKPKFNKIKSPQYGKVDQVKFPPPMPPKPKFNKLKSPQYGKVDEVKFPPPTVKNAKGDLGKLSPPEPPKAKIDVVKFPPPATGDLKTSSTGYQYEETGYLVARKTNFRVIIHEKNGEETAYFRNTATKAQIQLLKDKYGYTFPDIKIYDQLPPPPPAPPAAKPGAKTTGIQLGEKNSNGGVATKMGLNNVVYDTQEANTKRRFLPLIIVNNQRYTLSKDLQKRYENGEHLVFSATDSTIAYVRNTPYAISKWGPDATEGVLSLYGKTSITTTK
ncbi:M56 family metallopeptidase [Mucilaginibacter calamicampi]|uniref:M56 family metallopeptidase n=1 Tax=Mucilaginibacter calamicampi TaxID=1302352 RepID=A0ABW2YVJ2_9SPHI